MFVNHDSVFELFVCFGCLWSWMVEFVFVKMACSCNVICDSTSNLDIKLVFLSLI